MFSSFFLNDFVEPTEPVEYYFLVILIFKIKDELYAKPEILGYFYPRFAEDKLQYDYPQHSGVSKFMLC